MTYSIKNINGAELFKSDKAENIKEALQEAVRGGANLVGANLVGANLVGANLVGVNLSRANLVGADLVGANLRGANLRGAGLSSACLGSACLGSADLSRAYLVGANLVNTNLNNTNLIGADLSRAYLVGADLGDQWIIQGQIRSDGYQFFLQRLKDDVAPMIKAGCRYFTIADAQKHWELTRGNTPLGEETHIIVRALVDTMHLRGLK